MPSFLPARGQFEDLRQLTEFGLSHRQVQHAHRSRAVIALYICSLSTSVLPLSRPALTRALQMLQMKTAFVCGTGGQGDTWNKASEVVACCQSNGSCFAAMPDAPELVEKSAVETPAVVEE